MTRKHTINISVTVSVCQSFASNYKILPVPIQVGQWGISREQMAPFLAVGNFTVLSAGGFACEQSRSSPVGEKKVGPPAYVKKN